MQKRFVMIIHPDSENTSRFIIHSKTTMMKFYFLQSMIFFSLRKSIIGAKLSDFLLEKSRIVTHAHDERNYHVFYELLEGLTSDEKRQYGLTTPEKYFYLNQVMIVFNY